MLNCECFRTEQVLELVEGRQLADFKGLPNIYAGLAAVHRSRGDYQESQQAALAGIRAAKKRTGGSKGSSASGLHSVLSFTSALPALHDALGAAKAAAAGGALGPAREHFAEVLQKLFPRWKQVISKGNDCSYSCTTCCCPTTTKRLEMSDQNISPIRGNFDHLSLNA